MATNAQHPLSHRPAPPQKTALRVAFDMLASAKFAVAVVILIAVICALGTILPQGDEVASYLQKYPAAAPRIQLLGRLGLTQIFTVWWFMALLCVLASSVATCTTRRLAIARRATGSARRRALGSMLTHISLLLILAGAVIRGVWGEKGHLELRRGQTVAQFQSINGNRSLPFAVNLANFEIETDARPAPPAAATDSSQGQLIVDWPERQLRAQLPIDLNHVQTLTPQGETASPTNTFTITVLQYVPDFVMNQTTHQIASRSAQPNNPAVLMAVTGPGGTNRCWLFAHFPELSFATEQIGQPLPLRVTYQNQPAAVSDTPAGPIKNFKSTLRITDDGAVKIRTVSVNHPLAYKGYTFYQTGYNPDDPCWTSLQVVKDPGVPAVFAGFILLISGLFIVFYLNPWLQTKEMRI